MLLLKRHLIDLVRAGKKRQTIRLWKTRRLRPGQIAFTPGLGRLKIIAIDQLASLSALTAADARADGFASKKSLLAEIRAIYGTPLPTDRLIFRIQFQWPLPAADAAAASHKTKPAGSRAARKPRSAKAAGPKLQKPRRPAKSGVPASAQNARQSLRQFILSKAPRSA